MQKSPAAKSGLLALSLALFASCAVIRGREAPREPVGDAAIAAELKARMAADRAVAATSIGVDARQGLVRLSGFAGSQAEKERAAEIARQVEGVKAVRNDIVVRP